MSAQTVPVPEHLHDFVNDAIQSGRYQDAKQVVSAALETLKCEEEYQRQLAILEAAIDEGDASGIAEGDVIAQVREELGLPPRSI